MPTTAETTFFRKRHTSTAAYLAAILLFFLPFVQIKCNDRPFAENTGIGLAFGRDYKVSSGWQDQFGGTSGTTSKTTKESGQLYVLALLALIAGIAGLLLSLTLGRKAAVTNMILGSLAALFLIIVMIQITLDVNRHSRNTEQPGSHTEVIKVTADFTLWYYLSVCCFLAAAFFSYQHWHYLRTGQRSPTAPATTSTE